VNKGFFVPQEIAEKLIDVVNAAMKNRELNLGLFLDKYVLWWKERDKLMCDPGVQIAFLRKIESNPQDVKNKIKDINLRGRKFREAILRNERLSIPEKAFPSLNKYYEPYRKRIRYLIKILSQTGFHAKFLPKNGGLSLNWRLIINLGATSVYETSLLFHRNYSIPYIPGSAVKGVTRHWAIQKFAEAHQKSAGKIAVSLEKGEDLEISVDGITFRDIIDIFGTLDKKGEVIFLDALPIFDENKDFIILDIMNVHYRPYYEKSEVPGDWHSPTPIFFLAIEKGTKFKFALASRSEDLVEKTASLLKEALVNFGIGAKSSSGYGYFKILK